MREFGIGQSLPRVEDSRLVQGQGRYTDDIAPAGSTRMVVLRSVHASARIAAINTDAARAAPGVLAVLTGADVAREGFGGFGSRARKSGPDGKPNYEPPYPILAQGQVRFVGDPVAIVVAGTLDQAKSAAELIEVDYQPGPAVTSIAEALKPGAPALWEACPDNLCVLTELGDRKRTDEAFARASHVATVDLVITRVAAAPIEPRTALGQYDPADGRYTLHAGLQGPHYLRSEIANRVFKIPESRIRVISPDVGGAFGMKGQPHPELPLALWAARVVGRPVRWTAERAESFLGDHHARDNVVRSELALDAEGRFLGLRIRSNVNLGAYLSASGVHCSVNNLGGLSGVYTIGAVHAEIKAVFTNTSPTAAYRGAGRPEASLMIERVIDVAARELNIDPAELRRRNLIPASALPYATGFVFTYDSGDFDKSQREVLAMAKWQEFETRRRDAEKRGKLRGIGMAHVIEIAGGMSEEMGEIQIEPNGEATVTVGTHNHGQGHETTYRQLMSEFLGLDPAKVRIRFGDTDMLPVGNGTGGSRSITVAGFTLQALAKKIIDKAKILAARLLESDAADIEFEDGTFTVAGTDRKVSLTEVARLAYQPSQFPAGFESGLTERMLTRTPGPTFPNGCHVCEVEIDPDTGTTEVVGYWVVEDVGRAVNPKIVKGQVHGGVVQGLGQVFSEFIHYEQDGQLLTGSFMDYGMPRAEDIPDIQISSNDVPSRNNPLGIKGAGEGGTVGALPAAVNAVCDALRPLGIRHFDMPATPLRVWQAIQNARRG